jgi:hypothetical protein
VSVKKNTLNKAYKGIVSCPVEIPNAQARQIVKKIEIPPDLVAGNLCEDLSFTGSVSLFPIKSLLM